MNKFDLVTLHARGGSQIADCEAESINIAKLLNVPLQRVRIEHNGTFYMWACDAEIPKPIAKPARCTQQQPIYLNYCVLKAGHEGEHIFQ